MTLTAEPAVVAGPAASRRRSGLAGRLLLAAAGGLLVWLAFPPAGVWPAAPLGIAALVLALHEQRARRGALLGFVSGLAAFLPLLHWSGVFVGAVPWLLLAGSQAAFVAAFGALAPTVLRLPGWPVWTGGLWVAQEALRNRGPFGGFPWGRLAFAVTDSPLVRLAALGGAPLVSFAVALTGCCLAAAVLAPRRRPAIAGRTHPAMAAAGAALAAVLVVLAASAVPLSASGSRTAVVAVVQGNVPRLGLDFNAQREAVLRDHVRETLALAADVRAGRRPRPDLVIWPENSSDIDPLQDAGAAGLISQAVDAIGAPVLIGAVLDGPGTHLSNAGIVWAPGTGPGARYVKRHPAPFAEYIPLRPIARLVSKDVDRVAHDFAPGRSAQPLPTGPARVGDVICFEVAYDGLVRDVVRNGGDLLAVQTNNATFGRSAESVQQLAMVRLRAVEHGRWAVMASTTGVSAIIDPTGRIVARTRPFEPAALTERVALRSAATAATNLGAVPEAALAALGVLAVLGGVTRRRGQRAGTPRPGGRRRGGQG